MAYSDNYSGSEWGIEKLENHRRMQHTVEQDIDVTMIQAYSLNPYSQSIGIVPFSGQNSANLNADGVPKQALSVYNNLLLSGQADHQDKVSEC